MIQHNQNHSGVGYMATKSILKNIDMRSPVTMGTCPRPLKKSHFYKIHRKMSF